MRVLSPKVKGLGHNIQLLTPARAEVMNEWSYTYNPPTYLHDM
jgi:hypothetical protein